MIEYDRRDLVCLYLAAVEDTVEQSPAPTAVTATGIGDALEMDTTAVARVELLETLTDLQEAGLVVAEERPVRGSSAPRPVYGLTDAGEEHAAEVRERITQESVVVTNGTSETVTLAEVDRYFDGPAPLVTALARLTDGGEIPLDRYTGEGFVGRKAELETVREAIEQSFTQESGTIVVAGASGMGKTALVREAVSRVRSNESDLVVARGSSPSGASEPYAAFRQAFETLSTGTDLHDRLTEVQSAVSPADSDDLQAQRQALFSDIADGLREAITEPTVVFLDNLQWADEATLALFEHLVTTFDDWLTPVAFVGTYRLPAVAGTDHPLEDVLETIEGQETYREVRLDPLSQVDTRALLADVLGRHSLPEEFVELVHEQTGGNPLFVHETATYLLETGVVDSRTETYPTAADEVTLPDEVTDQIASRIEHLDAESRELLRLGAVIGERVPGGVLAAASDLPTGRYREYVDVLVSSHIWERVDGEDPGKRRADGDNDLQFVSGGLREAVVDRLPDEVAGEYHGRVATALESVSDGTDEYAGRLGRHSEQAGEYGTAFEYYRQAGDNAAEAYANEDAIEHYERALALADAHGAGTERTVGTAATELGDVFEVLGEYDRAEEYYERSLDVWRAIDDREGEARSLRRLGNISRKRSEYDRAREYYEDSLAICDAVGDHQGKAKSLKGLGAVADLRDEYDRAAEHYEESLALYREIGDRRGEADTLQRLGTVIHNRGEHDRAREYLERSFTIYQEVGDRKDEADSLRKLGVTASGLGEYDRARDHYERSLDIYQEIGRRWGEAGCHLNLGNIAFFRGEYDRAREYYEESQSLYRELGDRKFEASSLMNLGLIAYTRGEYDQAREYYEQIRPIYEELGSTGGKASTLQKLGHVAHERGAYERAREYYEESLAIYREIGDRRGETHSLVNIGHNATDRGAYDRAREYLTESLEQAREFGTVKPEMRSLRELGTVARENGEYDRAAKFLEESLAACEKGDNPGLRAKSHLKKGRLELVCGDVESARSALQQAEQIYAEIDAPHDEARAGLLRGRIAAVTDSPDEAREQFRAVLETFDAVGAPQDALETLRHLVETCRQQGDHDRADEWLERAETVFEDAPEPVKDQYSEWIERAGTDE